MNNLSFDFSGQTVIVTGGSSGIGRGIALKFGEAGANTIIADIREEPKDVDAVIPTHECILNRGGKSVFVKTDVSDPDQVISVVEAAHQFGGVDIMVNNAGIFLERPFLECEAAEFDRLHAINARGVFLGCQAAAQDMKERNRAGSIVNTASISANLAQHDLSMYQSTKGAVRMITRGAALELAEHDIRVNAVAPGAIATEFTEGLTEDTEVGAKADEFIKPIPSARAGYPEDVAYAVLFLASEQADYVVGELLHVDGGWQII